jgi:hypothetical protein
MNVGFSSIKLLISQKKALTNLSIRSFGGGGGHHGEHAYVTSKSKNSRIQIPTEEELDRELPKRPMFYMRLMRYIRTFWNV